MKINKLLFDKTLFKFIIVGVVNTLLGTAIMFLFYNVLHLSYWLSSASNYVFGSILSYFLNKHFTFNYNKKDIKSVIKFIVNISLCYLIAYGAAKPFIRWVLADASISLQDNASMLVGMVLFVILNYFGQKLFVFNEKNN